MITMRRAWTLLEVAEREKRAVCELRLAEVLNRRMGEHVAFILLLTAIAAVIVVLVKT